MRLVDEDDVGGRQLDLPRMQRDQSVCTEAT